MKIKNIVKRFFCLHLNWKIALAPKRHPGPFVTEWACIRCDKRKLFENGKEPVQWIGIG